jgi:hypothetical protein
MCRSKAQGSDAIVSTGDGPERAVLQQVIRLLITDPTSWTPATDDSGWVRPIFTPSLSTECQTRWKTAGTFILLHLLTLGNRPEPITPFLLYLLLASASHKGDQTLHSHTLLSLEALYQLDPGTAESLRPWMVLKETDQLSGFPSGQIPPLLTSVQNLLAQCGEYQVRPSLLSLPFIALIIQMQLSAVGATRCKDEHEGWTSALVTAIFLGCADPWERVQFQCLLDGFTAPLTGPSLTVTEVV